MSSSSASSEPAPKIISGPAQIRSTTPVLVGARVMTSNIQGAGATSLALVPQPGKGLCKLCGHKPAQGHHTDHGQRGSRDIAKDFHPITKCTNDTQPSDCATAAACQLPGPTPLWAKVFSPPSVMPHIWCLLMYRPDLAQTHNNLSHCYSCAVVRQSILQASKTHFSQPPLPVQAHGFKDSTSGSFR
ncbi:hypothetical protein cypCar_00008434 [Cyprinus carpio]|nr:hypothetical protein cypCar_00008434 [Cyprinus carpio]